MNDSKCYIIILFIISVLAYSQSDIGLNNLDHGKNMCGTNHGLSAANYEELLFQYHEDIHQHINTNREMQFIRVQFHIVRPDNGIGGLDEEALWPVFAQINEDYLPAGLQFYHPDVVHEIFDSEYFICDNDSELNTLRNLYDTPNILDIFIVNSATSGETALCGISTFTWFSVQGIVITQSCWNNETGSHEVGHYFDLFHTHESPYEYVDGTQCSSRGDGLCDTPADPDLSIAGNVTSSCFYTGTSTDGHGHLYDGEECMDYPPCAFYEGPDANNFMSYNLYDNCVDNFTNDQNEKIIYIAETQRSNYLVDPNYPFFEFNAIDYEETNGDFDQVINPGESIALTINFGLPEYWPVGADFVDVIVISEEAFIQIENEEMSFQNIQPGGSFENSNDPVIISFDSEASLGTYDFTIFLITENSQEFSFTLDVSLNQHGFPIYSASQKTSPLAVDFDNDGEDEIIYGDYNGLIHVVHSDGSEIIDNNFPFDTGDQIWGAVAAADIDNDGLMDIAVVSKSKHCYLLDINGLKVDYNANSWLIGTPAIGNIDDDIDLEVIFGGYSSSMKKIFAINADGSDVVGYPLDIGERVKIGVALADFNGNGKDDIVVGTDDDHIHLFYDDGSEAPGFPVAVGDKVQSAPAIIDVWGEKVIFAGSNDNNMYAINADGSLRFSMTTTNKVYNSPAFLEYNNTFYVFFSDESGILYALDLNGNALSGWPVDAGAIISKSVVFSDLDDDGSAEIIAVTELTDVLVYNLDGSSHVGFPMDNEFSFTAAPMVMDMDGDGDLEILAGSVNSLVAIDIKSSGISSGYWSMYRGNTLRSGYYDLENGSACVELGDINGDSAWNILDIVGLANCILALDCAEIENGCAADLNSDGIYNILDIVILANLILNN